MPNRILRDWTDSDSIELLDVNAERFFTRLIMKVDDFGRYQANIKLLKSNLFPLKSDIRETDISRWLTACEKSGLIALYNVANKEYLQISNFKQILRQKVEKYPPPDERNESATHVTSRRQADVSMKRNEVETESETNPKGAVGKNFIKNDQEEIQDAAPEIIFPFVSDEFMEMWGHWKKYKKTEYKFLYKSLESEQAALSELANLSKGFEETAIAIIRQSMAKGWKGFFELKLNENGSKQTGGNVDTGSAFAKINRMFNKAGST